MSIENNIKLANEFVKAFHERELDKVAALFVDPKVGQEYKDTLTNWFRMFPDSVWEPRQMTAQDDRVFIEAIDTGTHLGDLTWWVKEPVPPTKKKIKFQSCTVLICENGKLIKYYVYLNPMTILGQLGIRENIDWPSPIE